MHLLSVNNFCQLKVNNASHGKQRFSQEKQTPSSIKIVYYYEGEHCVRN